MRRLKVRIFSACAMLLALMIVTGGVSAAAADRPDLVIKKLSGLPESASPRDLLKLHAAVKNVGERKSGTGSELSFSLSEDEERSASDFPLGVKNLGRIDPGEKVEVVAKLNVPREATGTLYAITCVTKNRCKAFPNTIVVETEPDPGFPSAFVGTATATHTDSHTGTGAPDGTPGPSSSTRTFTLTATATFERFGTNEGYRYDATEGELEWTVSGNSSYSNPPEQCTLSGGTEPGPEFVPIGPVRETRFAYGSLFPLPDGSLAPGEQYSLSSGYDLIGLSTGDRNDEDYTRACNTGTYQGDFYPDNWLPKSRQFFEEQTCGPAFFTHTVGSDGSLVGHDSCSETITKDDYANGNSITFHDESRWDWSLTPVE